MGKFDVDPDLKFDERFVMKTTFDLNSEVRIEPITAQYTGATYSAVIGPSQV